MRRRQTATPGLDPAQDPRADAQGRTVARPALPLDERSLRRLCQDLHGRPAYEAERERWIGAGRHALLDAWLGSAEAWRHWLDEELYFLLLIDGFRPTSERVLALPGDLASGRLDPREALHRIALSASFDRRNPGSDTFVTVVLEQLVGMKVQKNARVLEIGKHMYDGEEGLLLGRRGSSQADVIAIAVGSKEFATTFLERQHQRLLRRAADPSALRAWALAFHRDPSSYLGVVREWLLSPAYDQRLATDVLAPNRLFVRSLFVDLTDRLPRPDEAEALRQALDGLADSLPLRAVVARMLIGSGRVPLPAKEGIEDPTAWVSGRFRRFLAREPEPEELQAFVHAFHEPECRPELLIESLVSDREYHVY